MDIEFIRAQVNGVSSTLTLLQENDSDFVSLLTITSHFAVTRKFDKVVGEYVDNLTVKLTTTEKKDKMILADAIDLVVNSITTRYRIKARTINRQMVDWFAFCDLAMIKNDNTAIV